MSKFSEKFEEVLMLVAEKVDDNKYLTSVKNAFTVAMPLIIVGSFATLFNLLICSPTSGLAKWIPTLENLKPAFTAMNFATIGIMTVPLVFLIAFNLARANKIPEYVTAILAVSSYFCVVPQVVTIVIDEKTGEASGVPAAALGAQGLFIGMILAILIVQFFTLLLRIKSLKIKMPDSVPTAISTSFNALIPMTITLVVASVSGWAFKTLTGSYINEWIYQVLQNPLEIIFQSPAGILAIVIISQLFWFLGIHGGLVISPIRNPLLAAAIAANIAAADAGQIPTQAVTYGFWLNFVVAGGAGMILSLIIALFIFSRRDDYRMIARIGILPGLCGISEPVVFGLPLVLNPTFAIPFIFNSALSCGIALFATNIGFLPANTVDVPFGIPVLLSAFIGHGFAGVIVQIICITVCVFTWAPFVLISNKQKTT